MPTIMQQRLLNHPLSSSSRLLGYRAWALFALLAGFLTLASSAQAQISGAKTINSAAATGGNNYQTFAAAFAALNAPAGISGPVTFSVSGGPYAESNLVLNSIVGSSGTNTVTFTGGTINAAAGTNANTSTGARDAIIVLNGADNVIFDGLTLTDPNATGNGRMEYGFLLTRTGTGATLDGCNNNTIRNCNISLQKDNVNTTTVTNTSSNSPTAIALSTAIGIASVPLPLATVGATTAQTTTATTAAGQSSNNKFYANTIENVYGGIVLIGLGNSTTTSPIPQGNYDQNNDIGGVGAGGATTGNIIRNFGGVTGTTTEANGIFLNFQSGVRVNNNTINNLTGGGTASLDKLTGVATGNSTVDANVTYSYNTINLTQSANAATYGVISNFGSPNNTNGTGGGTATTSISNNTVTLTVNNATTTAYANDAVGLYNLGATGAVNMNTNRVTLNATHTNTGTISGGLIGLQQNGLIKTAVTLNNNDVTVNVSVTSTGNFTGVSRGVVNANSVLDGATGGTLTMNTNTFTWVRLSAGQSATVPASTIAAVYNGSPINGGMTIDGNTWGPASGTATVNSTGQLYFIYNNSATLNNTVTNNTWQNIVRTGNSSATHYGYYSVGSPSSGTQTISSNTIANIDVANGGVSSNTLYGLYSSTNAGQRQVMANNTISTLTNFGTTYGLVNLSGTGGTVTTGSLYDNNTVTGLSSNYATASSPQYGMQIGSGAFRISGNTISNLATTGTGAQYGLNITGAAGATVNGNTISNIVNGNAASTGLVAGIYNTSAVADVTANGISEIKGNSSSTSSTVYGLYTASVGNVSNNTFTTKAGSPAAVYATGAGTVYGLYLAGSGTTTNTNVFGHTVSGISTTTGTAYGIFTANTNTTKVYQNKVTEVGATGAAGTVVGVNVGGTSVGTTTVYNNFIGNLTAAAATGLNAVAGLRIDNTSTSASVNVSFNSIYLAGTGSSTFFGSSGIYVASANPVVSLRNNIVVNKMTTPSATDVSKGATVAYRRISAATATNLPPTTNNNNLYFAGTPGVARLLYAENVTAAPANAQQTLASFKTYLNIACTNTNREQNSVSADPAFLSTASASSSFLHIDVTNPTPIESGGIDVAGITDDYDGQVRTAGAPDIGADEVTGVGVDTSAPTIAYTALANTGSTGPRTLTTTIFDVSGVSVTTANQPRLYYRKGTTGAYTSVTGTITGSGNNVTDVFTIPDILGLAIGDQVQYYVAAQDNSSSPNGGSNPYGSTSINPPGTVFSCPTPNSYTILPTLSGDYYVMGNAAATSGSSPGGATREYATLTAAMNSYNTSALGGPVTFYLFGTGTYTGETYPITVSANPDANPAVTLTIKPYTGKTPSFTGAPASAAALLRINSASYITLDGSNTVGGTTRDWSLTSTSTLSGSSVVALLSSGNTTGAIGSSNNVVMNLALTGGSSTSTNNLMGIFIGSGTINPGADNDNNLLLSNSIVKVSNGIYAVGAANVSALGMDNLQVVDNTIGGTSNDANTNIGSNGIYSASAVNPVYTGNTVQWVFNATNAVAGFNLTIIDGAMLQRNMARNIITNGSVGSSGIALGTTFLNGTVDRNNVQNVWSTNAFGLGGKGIAVNTLSATSNITLSNNFVSGISGPNGLTANNAVAGISIGTTGTTGGVKVYNNSVNLSGSYQANTTTAGLSAGITFATASSLDVRNNIFSNSLVSPTAGQKAYAFYSVAANTAYTAIDRNDYYVGATQGVLGYLGTDRTTLAALQAATGQDGNSKNVNPFFTSDTDLHTTAATLNNSAVALAAITEDYDGDPRGTSPDIGADEFTPLNRDVALTSIVSPVAPVAAGSQPVSVVILNNGASQLNSVTLSYTLNGTTVTQTFSGLGLASLGTATLTFTSPTNNGTVNAGLNTFSVTSSLPNGLADQNPTNDTQSSTFSGALSGVYTIDKSTATAGNNFNSFAAATAALVAGGIVSNVTFNVLNGPVGSPYTEQVVIPAYLGASPTQGVTINGNGQYLTFTGTSTNAATLALTSTTYVTVNNLNITNTGTTNGAGVVLTGTASNNTVSNCTVKVDITVTTTSVFGVAVGSSLTSATTGSGAINNTIIGNTIVGGYYGLTSYGVSATPSTGNKLLNNNVYDTYAYPIYTSYQTGEQIIGNDISRPNRTTTASNAYGIYLLSGNSGIRVEKNKLHDVFALMPTSAATFYALNAGLGATSSQPNEWLNNAVYNIGGQGNCYGISSSGTAYNTFYNNTVSFDDATASTGTLYAAFGSGTQTGSDWQNNIFSARRTGTGFRYGIYLQSGTIGLTSNNNDVVVNNGTNSYAGFDGTNRVTLANFTAATGLDANSVSVNPNFVSAALPKPQSALLNNVGNPGIAGPGQRVSDDITGAARSATPDLGAYEFVLPDLVVSSPGQAVSGDYNNVTVTGPTTGGAGTASLTGPLTVAGTLTVQNGGSLITNCQTVAGPGSFVLQAGGSLSVCSPYGITLTGTGNTSGPIQTTTRTFSNDANYIYNGTLAQVTGGGLPSRVRNLRLNNAAGLTLSQAVSVAEVAAMTRGVLTTNGQAFTLLSRQGVGTALIVDRNTNTTAIAGTGTMQRAVDILTGDNIGYHHYSSPVVTTPIEDLQTPGFDFVLNPAYNAAASAGLVQPFPTVFGYDNTRTISTTVGTDQTAFNKGFFSPAPNDAMPVGRGFTASVPNALTLDFNGTFNNGTINITGLTRASNDPSTGYQFLGNPYPAPLDWSTMTASQFTNLNQAAYQYHATSRYAGTYSTQLPNGITLPTGTSNLINAGAGFWVLLPVGQTTGALALTNANRDTTFASQPAFGRSASTSLQLVLQVRGAAGLTDQALVYADAQATAGVDATFDAAKLANPTGLNLATLAGTTMLTINGLPAFTTTTVVPLTLGVPAAGTYTFEVAQLANLGTTRAYLRDAVVGTETLLTASTQVPVSLTNVATATTRFSLVFRLSGALSTATDVLAAETSIYPNPAHGQFVLLLPPVTGQKEVQASLLNALGQVVSTRRIALNAAGATAEFSTASLARGVYVLRLQTGDQSTTRRVVVE